MAPDSPPNGISARIARIDERTKAIDSKLDRNHDELCKRLDDHEERIRGLEGANRQGVFRDIGTFLTAVAVGLVAWLTGKPAP